MCGIIACEKGWKGLKEAEERIAHRGASFHKRTERAGILFSHFLHSIVGSGIEQPFEGEGVLAANCEIYNWKELAKEHNLSVRNDAELLFKLLEQTDMNARSILDTANSLDGDYACVYFRDGIIAAFRDPLGVNPLFYSTKPLLFSSERKAAPDQLKELHPRILILHDAKTGKTRQIHNDFFGCLPAGRKGYNEIRKMLFDAIDKRAASAPSGILFSGGIDSMLIALRMREIGNSLTLYTAAIEKHAADAQYAKDFSRTYGFDCEEVFIGEEAAEQAIPAVCSIIDSCDSVKAGVALPLYFACRRAKDAGAKVIYSGLGADDIFAGYHRFKETHNICNEQLSSLRCIYERDLYRDNTVAMHHNIELRVPFLDRDLVKGALSLHQDQLSNKRIIRKVLKQDYGISEKFHSRPKKAAQYGSGSMKCLRKIARRDKKTTGTFLFNLFGRKNMKLGALYTGGKDSAYALYLMKRRNYDISCLITVKSSNPHSYMFHTPCIDAVEKHSERMGIPIVKVESKGEKEHELMDLRKALAVSQERYGIEGVVAGAIYSDYQRMRIETICDALGLRVFSPLWHTDQETHMRRLLKDGFRFIFTSVSADGLDESWKGRILTQEDVNALIQLGRQKGINAAGEGGEFESLVVECPLFKH